MRIEIISGSPRENSITRRVALHLHRLLKETTEHAIGLIDLKDCNLPLMQPVFTSVDNTPEPWKTLSKSVFEADGFILVTPEYNGSYSPAMKNLLDHFPKQHHKPFGIATASPGAMGGMRAAQQLLLLVPALFGVASPYLLIVPSVEKKFDKNGDLMDQSFYHSIHNFTTEFLWLAEKVVRDRVAI